MNNTVHLYWGRNKPLSWLQYLTVKSLRYHNPDATINVWYPKSTSADANWNTPEQNNNYTGKDWFDALDANIIEAPDFLHGIDGASEVHKSDVSRWYFLSLGGYWSDFDVLYTRPLSVFSNSEYDVAVYRCPGRTCSVISHRLVYSEEQWFGKWLRIGFMSAQSDAGKAYFEKIHFDSIKNLNVHEYQSAGSDTARKHEPVGLNVKWVTEDVVYPIHSQDITGMWKTGVYNGTDANIGIHWFAGSPLSTNAVEELLPETIDRYTGPIYDKIREVWS